MNRNIDRASRHPGEDTVRRVGGGTHLPTLIALAIASMAGAAHATSSITTTVGYDYDPATGRQIKTMIEPGNPELCMVTAYTLDVYGHHKTMTQRNCNGSAPSLAGAPSESAAPTDAAAFPSRVTTVGYTPDQRFIATSQVAGLPADTKGYDSRFGAQSSESESNGVTSGAAYDGFGRKILELSPDGTGFRFDYTLCNVQTGGTATCPYFALYVVTTTPVASVNLSTKTSGAAIGRYTKVYYDAFAREVRTETQGYDGSSASVPIYVDTTYDIASNVSQKTRPYYATSNPVISPVVYTYDSLQRLTSRTENDAAGSVKTSTTYNGLTVTETDGLLQNTVSVHNVAGLIATVTDNLGGTLSRSYDANGHIVQVVDAKGNISSHRFDSRGRKIESDDADMGTWTYTYDAANDLVSQTDAKNQVTTFGYDAMGRLIARAEPDLNTTWTYDSCPHGAGRLCEEKAGNGFDRKTTFDAQGRVAAIATTTINAAFSASQTFDAYGRVSQLNYPSGLAVKQTYTPLGYIQKITELHGNVDIWTGTAQDASGRPTQYTYGNGTASVDSYYDDGRLHTALAGTGNSVQNLLYTFDAAGNILDRGDMATGVTSTYGYDSLNRLTSESRNGAAIPGTQTMGWNYDSIGNMTTRTEAGIVNTYNYNPSGTGSLLPHAVANISGTVNGYSGPQYRYDANGNMTSGAGRNVSWTSFNMAQTISKGAASLSYLYGSSHERAQETYTSGGVVQRTTNYVAGMNGVTPFFERDTGVAGTKMRNYIMTPTGIAAVMTFDGASTWSTQYWHKDHLGSVSVVTDATGAVTERLAYEPYGKRRNVNGTTDTYGTLVATSTDRGYTGQEEMDEVGLVNMNGRIYDPALSRFMSADSTVPHPNNPQSFNRYSYTRNNPLRAVDPTGFDDVDEGTSDDDGDTGDTGDDDGYEGSTSSTSTSYGDTSTPTVFSLPTTLSLITIDSFTIPVLNFGPVAGLDLAGTGSVTGSAPVSTSGDLTGSATAATPPASPVSGLLTNATSQGNTKGQTCTVDAVRTSSLSLLGKDVSERSIQNEFSAAQGTSITDAAHYVGTTIGPWGTDKGATFDHSVVTVLGQNNMTGVAFHNQDENGHASSAVQADAIMNNTGGMAIIQVSVPDHPDLLHTATAQYQNGNFVVGNIDGSGGTNTFSSSDFHSGTVSVTTPGIFFGSSTATYQVLPTYSTILVKPAPK